MKRVALRLQEQAIELFVLRAVEFQVNNLVSFQTGQINMIGYAR